MKHVVAVDPDSTGLEGVGYFESCVEVGGVYCCSEAVCFVLVSRVFTRRTFDSFNLQVVLLPTLMASSLVLNLEMEQTGPKISSCIIFMSSVTLEKMVGSIK